MMMHGLANFKIEILHYAFNFIFGTVYYTICLNPIVRHLFGLSTVNLTISQGCQYELSLDQLGLARHSSCSVIRDTVNIS
jgi:hypothetical protein